MTAADREDVDRWRQEAWRQRARADRYQEVLENIAVHFAGPETTKVTFHEQPVEYWRGVFEEVLRDA